jgi:hypothetical protein
MGLGAQRLARLPIRWRKDLWKARASSRGTAVVLGNVIRSVDLALWPLLWRVRLCGSASGLLSIVESVKVMGLDICSAVIIDHRRTHQSE